MAEMKIIARIRTPFKTKFGIPRQSGVAAEVKGEISARARGLFAYMADMVLHRGGE